MLAWLLACGPADEPSPGGGGGGAVLAEVRGDTDVEMVPGDAACAPVATVADPNLLEGEAAAITVACSSGREVSAFDVRPVSAIADAAWDATTNTWSWATDKDDGGRWDVLFEVRPAGDAEVMPETAIATVWVADDWQAADNVPVDPAAYHEEWGLPVLHLDPEGGVSSEYVATTAVFRGETYRASMKIRGASSSGYPKPGYTVEFDPIQLDLDREGLGNKDHLVLISPFDDNSYVRQKLAYDLWADIATFWATPRLVPRTFFVVVYLDGAYRGLFTGIDHIDDEFVEEMGLNGLGNVYKSVDHSANFYRTYNGSNKSSLHQGYEKKEGEPADDFSDLDALVAFSADSSDDAFIAGMGSYLRYDEFMDWFLFVHYVEAADSGGKNAYLYNDPAATEFRYAPWDMNHSWGQSWYTSRVSAGTYNDYTWTNGIFAHFQSHPDASVELWDRFRAMQEPGGPLTVPNLRGRLDAYYAAIDDSAARDWEKWSASYRSYGGWASSRDAAGDWTDYEGEKAYLYQWIEDRDVYMRSAHP